MPHPIDNDVAGDRPDAPPPSVRTRADAARQTSLRPTPHDRHAGLAWGFAGVAAFSLTLPATRAAVGHLDPTFVGLGRAIVAATLAAIALAVARAPRPTGRQWRDLAIVALGVVVGFPLLSAWAMRQVPASHGAVLTGLLPLATAGAAAWLAHERPGPRFWRWAGFGSAVVVAFALWQGGGAPHAADLLLVGAVVAAGIGYAKGATLSRALGGWQVISWALLLAAPLLVVPTWMAADARTLDAPWTAWAGFAYVSVVSMYLGFFAWYRGLAQGGIAAVGQVQLLQPFLTLVASGLLLGEGLDPLTFVAAALVIVAIAMGRRA
jgi:drug/metabolite transporter (DMT)-like permease